MRLMMSLAVMAVTLTPAFCDDVPYAVPPPQRSGSFSDDLNSLGNVMGLTQLRHIKLWYAGRRQNWPLARYELNQIDDTFRHAAMLYRNIPISYVTSVGRQLDAIRRATDVGDPAAFVKGYSGLTAVCNECHGAAGVGFIVVQTPTASPFSDQRF